MVQDGASFEPIALLGEDVLLLGAPDGRQKQHHGVVGHLLDEDVRRIRHDDAGRRRGLHIHHVDADAAQADDDALVEPADDGLVEADAPRGDDRVAVGGAFDEGVGARTRHL